MKMQTDPVHDPIRVSIREVSRLLGIPIPTIRSWERRYGVPAVDRTSGGHRRYTLVDVEDLRAMRDEVGRGRSASVAAEIVSRARSAADTGREVVIEFLEGAHRLDPDLIEASLERSRAALGLERALTAVVLPAMRDVGLHWQAGMCDVANEHLATEVTRRWLARVSASVRDPAGPALVLGCGPKDLHTIGLEAFALLMTRRGYSCRVLGQQVPVESFVKAARTVRPAAIVVTSHISLARRAAVQALASLARIPATRVFYAGNAFVAASARRGVPGEYLGEDILDAAELLMRAVTAG